MVIQEYQDPKVGKYLKYGFWYMEHKGVIDRTWRLALVMIVVGIWSSAIWQLYGYVQQSAGSEELARSLVASQIPVESLHSARQPQPPIVSEAYVLPGRDELTADFVAWAENPNPDWYLEVDYIFNWSDGQTLPRSAFILPGAKAALFESGVTVNVLPSGAEVAVTPRKWVKLKDKKILDRLADFQDKISVAQTQVASDGRVTSATYVVDNGTIYDLLTPRFVVVLMQAGEPLAAGINEIDQLSFGESKIVEQRWLQSLPTNLEVEVWPQINVFDSSSYRLPKGGETKF